MKSPIKVHVYTHTHWDREWYRTFQQYRLRLIEVIDLILDQLDSGQLEYFTLDGQSIVIEDYLEVRPKNKDKLINYIKEGKIEIGPWYVLPDEFLVSGESLLNNILIGHKVSKKYGITNKVGYLPDTFGHSIDIPLILNQFNIDNCIMWRGINTNNTEFKWKSLSHNWVKAYHLINGYYNPVFDPDDTERPENKVEFLLDFLGKIKAKTNLKELLLPVGGDHRPPPINLKDEIEKINNAQSEYQLVQSTLTEFVKTIKEEDLTESIQTELRDCTQAYILPAVFSSRLYLKQNNARLTNKINGIIEPLTCYCNTLKLDKFKLPDSEYLWKLLIKNHPHDSICGCSIDEVHQEMEQRFKNLHQACDELINRSKFTLIKNVSEGKVAVFNASNFNYTGPVELISYKNIDPKIPSQKLSHFKDRYYSIYSDVDIVLPATVIKEQIKQLIWAENIAPRSLKIIEPAEIKNPVTYQNGILSNNLIKIEVNADSINVIDIETGKSYNKLNKIINRLDAGDSYNFGPIKGDKPKKAKITKYRLKEIGSIKSSIELIYKICIPKSLNDKRTGPSKETEKHTIKCTISLTANSKLVEFELEWKNKSEDHILQVEFPTDNAISSVLTENHFSVYDRKFDPEYNLYDHIPAEKYTELKTNTAPMQRFMQSNDISLFTEGLPEYEVFKNNLYITVLRSTGFLSVENSITRNAYAGPELAVPENQCLRKNTARYAFHPTTNISELYRLAENFMGCTEAIVGESKNTNSDLSNKQLPYWDNTAVISTCFKYDEETDSVIIRLLNTSETSQSINIYSHLYIESITEINALKKHIGKATRKNKISFKAYELKGLMIKLK